MRKKVIFGAVAALFLGAGIFTSVNLTQKPKMSNLTLANIEAMTIPKDDQEITVYCNPITENECKTVIVKDFTGAIISKTIHYGVPIM